MIPNVPINIQSLPKDNPVFIEKPQGIFEDAMGGGTEEGETTNILSAAYVSYFRKIEEVVKNLNSQGSPGFLLNPDFNILSANGTAPVTPAQGSNYEVLKQWYIVNGGGGNAYTLTPTAISSIPIAGSSSNYLLNVNATAINTALYLYNLNYSLTGAFNSIEGFNSSPANFSFVIDNKTSDTQFIQFSAFYSGGTFPDGSNEIFTEELALKPGPQLTYSGLQFPDLTGLSYSPSDFIQFRMYFPRLEGALLDLDIYYVKAEAQSGVSLLQVNPVLQQFICNNLV